MNDENDASLSDTGIIEAAPGAIVASTYEAPPRRRTPWLLSAVVFVSIATVLGLGIAHISSQQAQINTKDERIIQLNEINRALIEENAAVVENSQTLYDQIIQLGEVPQGTNPATIPGPPGTQGLRGLPGTNGLDGLPGSPGADGSDGLNGTNGKDGQDGAPGAPGATGAQGEPGAPGADGRGIANAACTGLNEFTITYTDSTAQTFNIPCVP